MKELKTKKDFDDFLKEAGSKLVVIDFFAEWCGPCKMIGPKLEKMAAEEFPNVCFAKVDVDGNEETAEECGISAMPTFQCYKDGKKVDELTGANEAKLREMINKYQ